MAGIYAGTSSSVHLAEFSNLEQKTKPWGRQEEIGSFRVWFLQRIRDTFITFPERHQSLSITHYFCILLCFFFSPSSFLLIFWCPLQ
jgi:hypothetical protein